MAVCAADVSALERIGWALTAAGLELVQVSESLESLIVSCPNSDPHLIVLVASFEPFAPSAEIAMLRARLPDVPLVIVARGRIGAPARKLVLAQADGLVHEADLEQALPAAVHCVLADQLCVPESVRDALAQPVFSYREKQVLELVLAGLTNGEIAGRLFLSESTVKSHLASSFRKLGVSSRAEAAKRLREPDSGLDLATRSAEVSAILPTPNLA